jgi:tape measure domain-containing protein
MADASKVLEIVIQAKDEATKVLNNFGKNVKDVSQQTRAGAIALAALGTATVVLGKQFVDAAGYVEVQRTAMRTLIGDVELAEKTYKDLVTMAAKTPFEIPQILEQSKRLLAMGVDAKDLTKTFGMLGDVASGVGMEKLPQLVLAFGQISSKGRLMGTELRQLTEAGFNLADAMGISNERLDQLVTDKAVKFEDVRKAFEKVTGEGGRFYGLMDKLALTTPGKLSNLNDGIFKLKAALGDALLPAVNQTLDRIIPLTQTFADFASKNPKVVIAIMGIATALGAIGAGFLIFLPIIKGVMGIFTIFKVILAVIFTPIGLIVVAIGALALAGYLIYKNWDKISPILKRVGDAFSSLGKYFMFVIKYGDELNDWVTHLPESIQGVVISLGKFINSIMAIPGKILEFGQSIKAGFDRTVADVQKFVSDTINWFQQLPERIGAFFYDLFFTKIPYAIGFLTTAIPGLIDVIVQWFNTLPERISIAWDNLKMAIALKATEIWNDLTVWATNIVDSITNWFNLLPGRVSDIYNSVKNAIVQKITETWNWISSTVSTWPGKISAFLKSIPGDIKKILDELKTAWDTKLGEIWKGISDFKDKVVNAFNAIIQAAKDAIEAIKRGFEAGQKAGGNIFKPQSNQHGGFIDAPYGQAVPAILHGGERVVPRNGTDVNGGGISVSISFTGPVNMDSTSRVEELADMIGKVLGRQNELATKGLAI